MKEPDALAKYLRRAATDLVNTHQLLDEYGVGRLAPDGEPLSLEARVQIALSTRRERLVEASDGDVAQALRVEAALTARESKRRPRREP